jgi:hypothetical protein
VRSLRQERLREERRQSRKRFEKNADEFAQELHAHVPCAHPHVELPTNDRHIPPPWCQGMTLSGRGKTRQVPGS